MLRFFSWLFMLAIGLAVAVSAAAWYLLSDPNSLKPELTRIIEERTGVPVAINGDLGWQLWPPLRLNAGDITATHEGSEYAVEALRLNLDLQSVISNQDLEAWQVRSLEVDNLTITTAADVTHLEYLQLQNFAFDRASPFKTRVTYTGADEEIVPLEAQGLITYRPERDEVQ